jgi:hypothetical protein
MTNRNMVNNAGKATEGGRRMPGPNPASPTPVPAPEGAPQVWTTRDPVDSPQIGRRSARNAQRACVSPEPAPGFPLALAVLPR